MQVELAEISVTHAQRSTPFGKTGLPTARSFYEEVWIALSKNARPRSLYASAVGYPYSGIEFREMRKITGIIHVFRRTE